MIRSASDRQTSPRESTRRFRRLCWYFQKVFHRGLIPYPGGESRTTETANRREINRNNIYVAGDTWTKAGDSGPRFNRKQYIYRASCEVNTTARGVYGKHYQLWPGAFSLPYSQRLARATLNASPPLFPLSWNFHRRSRARAITRAKENKYEVPRWSLGPWRPGELTVARGWRSIFPRGECATRLRRVLTGKPVTVSPLAEKSLAHPNERRCVS